MLELIVIGGGFAGCAVALELERHGAGVNLLERHTLGSAATGASAGMLAPQIEQIREAVARFFPALEGKRPSEHWADLRPFRAITFRSWAATRK